jgi:hypothetical protein
LLETDTSDRGETVGTAEAVTLPLNGRSYADLSVLVPGVRKSLLDTVASNPPRDASYNVNGLTSQSNNFELDGIDNNAYQEANQGYSNEAVIPSPDAVQEFKVQTDNFSAEYGRAGGAIFNVTTRSGSNTFHGGAYDYLRNTDLNAFGPFLGTGVKPTLVQNQFGATFGGPIFKDKLFFFTDYEGLRAVAHLLTQATLPTPTELTGLFTSDGTATGTPIPIENPYNPGGSQDLRGSARAEHHLRRISKERYPKHELPVLARQHHYRRQGGRARRLQSQCQAERLLPLQPARGYLLPAAQLPRAGRR